jgi:hypothetical protein
LLPDSNPSSTVGAKFERKNADETWDFWGAAARNMGLDVFLLMFASGSAIPCAPTGAPMYSRKKTSNDHVFCSFLALVLKRELAQCIADLKREAS